MGAPDPYINIMNLAAEAKRKGYSDPDRLIERLNTIIKRNARYTARPYRQGRGFNEVIEEDNQALAYLVVLLQTMKEEGI
jgi:hypothetical protein